MDREPGCGFRGVGPALRDVPCFLQVTSCASLVSVAAREEYLQVVGAMCQELQAARYNGSYFDRGAKAGRRLCTPEGWFSCQVSPQAPLKGLRGGAALACQPSWGEGRGSLASGSQALVALEPVGGW